ncbi:MAG: glycosyltransferase family 2 protein [Prevotella sp.]|jgi:glycosyltransferase involved in cell wall biosynthesis|nr:glycosyltransferase family 2 protein [Prevotella sp.]
MKTALLISTYNWPEALNLIFLSLKKQTALPDEILIADDGSRNETGSLIDQFRTEISVPVKHVWHEDKGFRKSQILNKAIAAADADYIIQIDGDCIMHAHFVEDHLKNAAENVYLYGTRVAVPLKSVPEVIGKQIISFGFFSPLIKKRTRLLRIPLLSKLYKKHPSYSTKMRGCNWSFWRNDFMAVNGYNEDFEGWGKEDSDLAIRLINNGLCSRRLRYAGIVFHIDHLSASKDNLERNRKMQENTVVNRLIRSRNGVDKYL